MDYVQRYLIDLFLRCYQPSRFAHHLDDRW